jgi:phosphoribosylformylglycinamidine synthase
VRQWRIEITSKAGFPDVYGKATLGSIRELAISSVESVFFARVYLIEADFDEAFAQRVARELLADPVCQEYFIGRSSVPVGPAQATLVEVHLKSGVTDPVAESVLAALKDMGAADVQSVRTARKYVLLGHISSDEIQTISRRALANDCIEEVVYGSDAEPPSAHTKSYELNLTHIPISHLNDEQLTQLSRQMDLFLNLTEMKTIQDYFQRIGREPTDIELETLAQTWSEHCGHKTFRSAVDMEMDGKPIHFNNLL